MPKLSYFAYVALIIVALFVHAIIFAETFSEVKNHKAQTSVDVAKMKNELSREIFSARDLHKFSCLDHCSEEAMYADPEDEYDSRMKQYRACFKECIDDTRIYNPE